MKFDEAFYKVIDKLEVLAHSEKRKDAIKAGKQMIRILQQIETDDDHFPLFDIALICRTVDPFGTDEELTEIMGSLFR